MDAFLNLALFVGVFYLIIGEALYFVSTAPPLLARAFDMQSVTQRTAFESAERARDAAHAGVEEFAAPREMSRSGTGPPSALRNTHRKFAELAPSACGTPVAPQLRNVEVRTSCSS